MLIFLCWLFILVNLLHFAYSLSLSSSSSSSSSSSPSSSSDPSAAALTSKPACIFHDQELLAFTEQPFSVCLPGLDVYTARCSASRLKNGNVFVLWNVTESGLSYPFKVDANGSLSLTCENRQRGCYFKVWCELVDPQMEAPHFANLAPSIRSRTATVNIGNGVQCQNSTLLFTVQQPEPRARTVKVQHMTNVTLPCLTLISHRDRNSPLHSNYYYLTNWYRNGRRLFDEKSALFEADGTFSIERQPRDDFFLWSNLTIYHIQQQHSGYYQCFIGNEDQYPQNFNVIYLEVIPVPVDVSISLSSPVITDVSYPNSREIRIYFRKAEISFRKGELTTNITSRASTFTMLNYTIGVVRQRKLFINASSDSSPRYLNCLAGVEGPGAETSFSSAHLAYNDDGIADFELPQNFFADRDSCQHFYSYAVFIKYFSYKLNLTSVSALYQLSYDRNSNNNKDHLSLAIDEARSGVHYACLSSKHNAALLTPTHSNRLIPVTQLQQREKISLEAFCSCNCRSGEAESAASAITTEFGTQNTSFLQSISLTHVPFLTDGLLPNTSYCILSETKCVTYFVPGSPSSDNNNNNNGRVTRQAHLQAQPLSFERLPNNTIAVSWSLAHCHKQLSKEFQWSIQLLNHQGIRTRIPTTDCSGRVLFHNVPYFTTRHDVSLSYDDDTDLSVLAVPAMFLIENLSAFIITRSRILLSWIVAGFVEDLAENQRATEVGYTIYACLPSTPLPSNGLMDKKTLECLGCRFVCRVSAYSVTVNDIMHAELTGYDEHVTDFKFVVWADVSLVIDPGKDYDTTQVNDQLLVHEMVPLGIVGQINIKLDNKKIDGLRPQGVLLFADLDASQTPDWNVSWQAPPFHQDNLTLVSYTVQIVPVSHHLFDFSEHHDDNYYNILVRILPPDQLSIYISNATNELISESAEKCPRLWPEAYIVQVVPVWAWEHRHKYRNSSFIIDGAPSAPFVFRTKIDQTVEDDKERLSRLRERALAYEEIIRDLSNSEQPQQDAFRDKSFLRSSTSNNVVSGSNNDNLNNNEINDLFPSSLLPVPIIVSCIAFLCILFIVMFFIYRYHVRHHAAKYSLRPGSGESSCDQETRLFVSNSTTTTTTTLPPPQLPYSGLPQIAVGVPLLFSSMNVET